MTGTALICLHGYLSYPVRWICWRGYQPLFDEMRRRGVEVLTPQLKPTGRIEQRAQQAADLLAAMPPQRRVLILAHSLGGLDARFLASRLDPERRIKAIITLMTPHRGSVLAEQALLANEPLSWLLRRLDRGGLAQMTRNAVAEFNKQNPNRADIHYASLLAQRPPRELPLLARGLGGTLAKFEGPNDGQVAVRAAAWGEAHGPVRADHWELIGVNMTGRRIVSEERPFDPQPVLRQLIERALAVTAAADTDTNSDTDPAATASSAA